jgi:hypothetical protein
MISKAFLCLFVVLATASARNLLGQDGSYYDAEGGVVEDESLLPLDSRTELLRDLILPQWWREQRRQPSTRQLVDERLSGSRHLSANEEISVLHEQASRFLAPFNLFKRFYDGVEQIFDSQRRALDVLRRLDGGSNEEEEEEELEDSDGAKVDLESDRALALAMDAARQHRRRRRRTDDVRSSSSSSSSMASSTCSGVGIEQLSGECVCPLDFVGDACESKRPFLCAYELVSPPPHCKTASGDVEASYGQLADGDPVCFEYKRSQDAPVFTYRLRCAFASSDGLPATATNDTHRDDFDYLAHAWDARGKHVFAVSNVQNATADWRLLLKVFNFNKLSDLGASQVAELTAEQIVGADTVSFTLPLASYATHYLSGGRLYFECGLYAALGYWPDGLVRRTHDRRFIDFTDYHGKGYPSLDSSLAGWQIALIIVGVLALIGLAAYVVYRIQEYRKQKED